MVSVPLSLWAGPEDAVADITDAVVAPSAEDFFAGVNLPIPQTEPQFAPESADWADKYNETIREAEPADITPPAIAPDQPVIPSPEQVAISAEMAQQARIHEAEQEYMAASMRVNEIEDEIADKKAELKEAKELWQALYVRLCAIQAGDMPDDEDDDDDDLDPDAATDLDPEKVGGEPAREATGTASPPLASDSAWRSQPLRDIITGTTGCGQKKLDAICEQLPTLGHFVDLQGKTGGFGIHTEMPKGVGRGLCDALEEKVLNWLAANRDKFGEPAELNYGTITPAIESPPAPSAPQEALPAQGISTEAATPDGPGASNDADVSGATGDEAPNPPPQVLSSPPSAVEHLPDDDLQAGQIRTRLKSLDRSMAPPNQSVYEDGRHAAREEWPVTDCNWTAGPNQDSWLLGWLSIPPAESN